MAAVWNVALIGVILTAIDISWWICLNCWKLPLEAGWDACVGQDSSDCVGSPSYSSQIFPLHPGRESLVPPRPCSAVNTAQWAVPLYQCNCKGTVHLCSAAPQRPRGKHPSSAPTCTEQRLSCSPECSTWHMQPLGGRDLWVSCKCHAENKKRGPMPWVTQESLDICAGIWYQGIQYRIYYRKIITWKNPWRINKILGDCICFWINDTFW